MITGATAGIGKATALKLAEIGYNLIITGRRKELLTKLEHQIRNSWANEVISLCFDVQNQEEVNKAMDSLPNEWQSVDLLINNAGLAMGMSSFENGDMNDWETMINTNVKGLLYVTKRVVPFMVSKQSGQIVNIGSVAGKEIYPMGNVYCASKFAVDALTKSMRIDLVKHNIKVSQICPGMVETEFSLVRFKGDKERAKKVYDGVTPLFAEDIADAIVYIATRPKHVNINDMIIMPTQQASTMVVDRKI